LNRRLWGIWW